MDSLTPANVGSDHTCAQGSRGECPTQRAAFLARVRDSIAEICPGGERFSPEAHDLQARFVAALHDALAGSISTVAGHRLPQHLRDALRGQRHLTDCDLARFCRDAPRAAAAGLAVLADACGYELTPKRPMPVSLARASAAVSRRVGPLVAMAIDAEADGVVTAEEGHAIAQEAASVVRDAVALEQAARKVARG